MKTDEDLPLESPWSIDESICSIFVFVQPFQGKEVAKILSASVAPDVKIISYPGWQ
jgi:hypothetical protein